MAVMSENSLSTKSATSAPNYSMLARTLAQPAPASPPGFERAEIVQPDVFLSPLPLAAPSTPPPLPPSGPVDDPLVDPGTNLPFLTSTHDQLLDDKRALRCEAIQPLEAPLTPTPVGLVFDKTDTTGTSSTHIPFEDFGNRDTDISMSDPSNDRQDKAYSVGTNLDRTSVAESFDSHRTPRETGTTAELARNELDNETLRSSNVEVQMMGKRSPSPSPDSSRRYHKRARLWTCYPCDAPSTVLPGDTSPATPLLGLSDIDVAVSALHMLSKPPEPMIGITPSTSTTGNWIALGADIGTGDTGKNRKSSSPEAVERSPQGGTSMDPARRTRRLADSESTVFIDEGTALEEPFSTQTLSTVSVKRVVILHFTFIHRPVWKGPVISPSWLTVCFLRQSLRCVPRKHLRQPKKARILNFGHMIGFLNCLTRSPLIERRCCTTLK
ncbi:hypothetical protein M427DRAFT_137865 [Gonapodya prolifera JEL478]|uniref:Uncharacterized protein n=1 Tax=Gonapodya prolifera (strain JEL478) TaxID=1344416 RepID=A0A139A4Q4_GONPJ|nr:hypothetical protein M427DRAFT_137865 [Gonapodya prolifera JEL478]|eukprot:KXS11776.1 hypothetical protein M427DRAFT_137865 [Gonapodya prolifera JEL478]